MPHIIPIRDLKDTSAISQMCHEHSEPIFVTKNGYGDMVIMSIETYKKIFEGYAIDIAIAEAEAEIKEGNVSDAREGLKAMREKYGL